MSRTTKIRAAIEKLLKVELKIANARGEKIVPFRLNPSQAELDLSAEHGGKHAILKARQLGISTYIVARFLMRCLTVEGTHAVIISHERQATIKLLRKAKFFVQELRKEGIEVNVGYDSKSEMTFPDFNSSLYIGTAGQKAFSRGDTVTCVHASEVAFWEGAEELMRGVLGACTPDAEIFLESTANGAGGYFYDICQKAMAAHPHWSKFSQKPTGPGSTDWGFHFYPWTDEPLYASDVPKNQPFWTKEEQDLKERHGLTLRQLMWRRNKIGDFKSLDDFLAEYPLTPDEAFIVTGSCYFDKPTLRLYEKLCADPIATGAVEMVGQRPQLNRFAPDEGAHLSVWEYPRAGFNYIVPADASEGIEGDETDEAVAPVICRDLYKQVAVLAGKIPPLDYADQLYALGAYYNWALIAVEDNGPGLGTLHKLIQLGYPNIYYHKRLDLEKGEEIVKPGWRTGEQTRPLALGQLRSDFKKQQIYPRDRRFLRQCTTFCRQKSGRYEANSGCHDDHVMAFAIGAYIHAHEPMPVARDEVDSRSQGGSSAAPQSSSKSGY